MPPLSTPPPNMLSLAQRERALSPSSCIGGNYQPYVAAYGIQSEEAEQRTTRAGASWQTLHYGDAAAHTIELCLPPAQHCIGLLIFIHGGYWQELSARDSRFPALGCVEHKLAFAAINYTLAPHATITQIVAECERAVAYLQRHAPSFGFEADRIVIAGSSAGAHLAAMVCASARVDLLRGAVLVSGIYALEPLLGTSINNALKMDANEAYANSPQSLPRKRFPSTIIAWGEIETDEFKRQSAAFAGALVGDGALVECLEIPARNHFDVIMDLAECRTPLGAKALALFNESRT